MGEGFSFKQGVIVILYQEGDIGKRHERGKVKGLVMWTYGARNLEEERPASTKSLRYEHS